MRVAPAHAHRLLAHAHSLLAHAHYLLVAVSDAPRPTARAEATPLTRRRRRLCFRRDSRAAAWRARTTAREGCTRLAAGWQRQIRAAIRERADNLHSGMCSMVHIVRLAEARHVDS
eukprot:6210552-Pleurochrysis_carterae.AAC.2